MSGAGWLYCLFFFFIITLMFWVLTPERKRSGKLLVTKHLQFILSFGFVYIHVDSQFFLLSLLGIFISCCLTEAKAQCSGALGRWGGGFISHHSVNTGDFVFSCRILVCCFFSFSKLDRQ